MSVTVEFRRIRIMLDDTIGDFFENKTIEKNGSAKIFEPNEYYEEAENQTSAEVQKLLPCFIYKNINDFSDLLPHWATIFNWNNRALAGQTDATTQAQLRTDYKNAIENIIAAKDRCNVTKDNKHDILADMIIIGEGVEYRGAQ